MTNGGGISKEFVGIILLPIAGNVEEIVIAGTVSMKDKLNHSLGVLIGSSIVSIYISVPGCEGLIKLTANCTIRHSVSTWNPCFFRL